MSDIEIGSVWKGKNNEGDVLIVWSNKNRVHYDYLKSNKKPTGDVYDVSVSHFLEYFEPKADMVNEQAAPFASWDFGTADKTVTCEFYAIDEQAKPERKHSHYFIDVSGLEFIDVYHLCKRAKIQDDSGATHHALKKLLFSGKRGSKDRIKDLNEAVDTLQRLIEIERLESQQ